MKKKVFDFLAQELNQGDLILVIDKKGKHPSVCYGFINKSNEFGVLHDVIFQNKSSQNVLKITDEQFENLFKINPYYEKENQGRRKRGCCTL